LPSRLALSLPLLLVCACATASRPRVVVTLAASEWPSDTQVHWYDIEGDTAPQLRTSLDAQGPLDLHGERHDAYTAWHVTWRFPFVEGEAGCTTGPVETTVRANITLPRWRGFDGQDALTKRWRRYLEALKNHESGHREMGFRAAADIAQQLPDLPPQPTCEAAEAAANAVALHVLEQHRQYDLDYDAKTDHGASQGALFP
jgi:predicted secreted Zn-dependent protease